MGSHHCFICCSLLSRLFVWSRSFSLALLKVKIRLFSRVPNSALDFLIKRTMFSSSRIRPSQLQLKILFSWPLAVRGALSHAFAFDVNVALTLKLLSPAIATRDHYHQCLGEKRGGESCYRCQTSGKVRTDAKNQREDNLWWLLSILLTSNFFFSKYALPTHFHSGLLSLLQSSHQAAGSESSWK